MQKRKLKQFIYQVRHEYLTSSNLVLAVALFIASSWAIASVQAVERNYQLQHVIDGKKRHLRLAELQADTLQFEQRYFKSAEYQSLELKRRQGLAERGEHVLVLPPNSKRATLVDANNPTVASAPEKQPQFEQWMDFLFGDKPSEA